MLLAILLSVSVNNGPPLPAGNVINFGSTYSWLTLDVVNDGSTPLPVIEAQADGRFYADDHACDALAPGESCRIWLKFRPHRAGDYTGTLTISTGTDQLQYRLRGLSYGIYPDG